MDERGLSGLCPPWGLGAPGRQALVLLPVSFPRTPCTADPQPHVQEAGSPRTVPEPQLGVWGEVEGPRLGGCPAQPGVPLKPVCRLEGPWRGAKTPSGC